ncbi:MAG: hypothetical protein JRN42_08180 [Nitrososphaerota archaeon]|nr:hypothetical protein [Nitrososphaerota archaeon]
MTERESSEYVIPPTRLSLTDAIYLGEILEGCKDGSRLQIFSVMNGDVNADSPGNYVMRAITQDGGGAIWHDGDGDVRDACVWLSGVIERFVKVRDLIPALKAYYSTWEDRDWIAVIRKGD